jgi:hypothetical protein
MVHAACSGVRCNVTGLFNGLETGTSPDGPMEWLDDSCSSVN